MLEVALIEDEGGGESLVAGVGAFTPAASVLVLVVVMREVEERDAAVVTN